MTLLAIGIVSWACSPVSPLTQETGTETGESAVNNPNKPSVTGICSEVTTTQATLSGWANLITMNEATFGMAWSDDLNASKDAFQRMRSTILKDDNSYTCRLTALHPGTTYQYCSYVEYVNGNILFGDIKQFRTKDFVVETRVEEINTNHASILISSNIDNPDIVIGIIIIREDTITWLREDDERYESMTDAEIVLSNGFSQKAEKDSQSSNLIVSLDNLPPRCKYKYIAYAKINSDIVLYGKLDSFSTDDILMQVGPPKKISTYGAVIPYSFGNLSAFPYEEYTYGFIWSSINEVPTYYQREEGIVIYPREAKEADSGSLYIGGLKPNTEYYYRPFFRTKSDEVYGEVSTFRTGTLCKPELVDLGLSVSWANWNIGASAPEEAGDLYAWGETESKPAYLMEHYKYMRWSNNGFIPYLYTKYTVTDSPFNYYTEDNQTTLLQEDDVATLLFDNGYRIPTRDEWDELFRNCSVSTTTIGSVKGWKFTGPNGNSIFIPNGGRVDFVGEVVFGMDYSDYLEDSGGYWSSSLNINNNHYETHNAYCFQSEDKECGMSGVNRVSGYSIRAVGPIQAKHLSVEKFIYQMQDGSINSGDRVVLNGWVLAKNGSGIIVGDVPSDGCVVGRGIFIPGSWDSIQTGDLISVSGEATFWIGCITVSAAITKKGHQDVDFSQTSSQLICKDDYQFDGSAYYVSCRVRVGNDAGYGLYDGKMYRADGVAQSIFPLDFMSVDGPNVSPGQELFVHAFAVKNNIELILTEYLPVYSTMTIGKIAADNNTNITEVAGVVTAVSSAGMILSDGTGHMLVYCGSDYSQKNRIGEIVSVVGHLTPYLYALEFTDIQSITKLSDPIPLYYSCQDINYEAINDNLSNNPYSGNRLATPYYLHESGRLDKKGYRFMLHSDQYPSAIVYLYWPNDTIEAELERLVGKYVAVKGFYIFASSDIEGNLMWNFMPTKLYY